MRLAIVTNAYPPNAKGGAGQVAHELAGRWQAAGHEVRVFTEYAAWLHKNMCVRLFGHLLYEYRLPRCTQALLAWHPDVVITHNLTGCGLLSVGRWLQRQRFPWVHILHDVQLFEPSGLLREDVLTSWQRAWSTYRQAWFRHPDVVVSPTQWLLDAHRRRGWFLQEKTQVLANPLPKPPHSPLSGGGQTADSPWLFVGRLSIEKGAYLLRDLMRERPHETCLVIGDGEARSDLGMIPNLQLLGEQPPELVHAWMQKSRALLMPSQVQENQPNVLLEAFACGLPVIASAVGGVPETLGSAGMLCSKERVEEWMKACDRFLDHEASWREKVLLRAKELAYDPAYWEAVFTSARSNSNTHTRS